MLISFQALSTTLSQIGSIISTKLSANQSIQLQAGLMELIFKRTIANEFKAELGLSEGNIETPSTLCEAFNFNYISRSNTLLSSQVCFIYLQL